METEETLKRYRNDILPSMSHKELIKEFEDVTRHNQSRRDGLLADALQCVKEEMNNRFVPER